MLDRIKQNKFLKSISILVTGSLLAQLVTILTAPIMTHLFSAESIGIYTYVTSVAFLLLPVINGKYDLAIITEKNTTKVFALVKLCMYFCFVLVTVFSVGIAVYSYWFNKFLEYREYFIFIPLLLLVSGYIGTISSYNNRFAKYRLMSKVAIVRAVAMCALVIVFGAINFDVWCLLAATLISNFASLKTQSQDLLNDINDVLRINFEQIKEVAVEYKGFLFFLLLQLLLIVLLFLQ